MRINTHVVYQMNSDGMVLTHRDAHNHSGEVSHCGGGGKECAPPPPPAEPQYNYTPPDPMNAGLGALGAGAQTL